MNLGETFVGYDSGNHLWVVVSVPTERGEIAIVNLTTHTRRRGCGDHCVTVGPGEHAFVRHESCVYYREAVLRPVQPFIEEKAHSRLRQWEPFSPELLRRVQEGALASPIPDIDFKDAVRETLRRGR